MKCGQSKQEVAGGQPFFSVIIPVCDKEITVARAIESVLSQTFKDFEVLIVTEPSLDGSDDIVSQYTDPRLRVIRRDQRGPGGYAARNAGINQAMGQWICFLDADDEYLPTTLATRSNYISQYPALNIIITAQIRKISKSDIGHVVFSSNHQNAEIYELSEYLDMALSGSQPFHPNAVCISRAKCPHMLFPEGRTQRQGDLYAWVILLSQLRYFLYVPEVCSIWNVDVARNDTNPRPSLKLAHELVKDSDQTCQPEINIKIKKYSNRLIKIAALSRKRTGEGNDFPLWRAFFWRPEPWYCIKWYFLIGIIAPPYYGSQRLWNRVIGAIRS